MTSNSHILGILSLHNWIDESYPEDRLFKERFKNAQTFPSCSESEPRASFKFVLTDSCLLVTLGGQCIIPHSR